MFVFKATLERLEEEIDDLKRAVARAEEKSAYDRKALEDNNREIAFFNRCADVKRREAELSKEEALNSLRKEMQKALVESDLKRVAAESRLAAYEKMDPKTERTAQAKLLEKAVDGLCNRKPADIRIETAK